MVIISRMGNFLCLPLKLAGTTCNFYGGLFHYLFGKGRRSRYVSDGENSGKDGKVGKVGKNGKGELSFLKCDSSDSLEDIMFKKHARIHLFTLASAFYLYHKPHYRKDSYAEDLVDNFCNVAIPGTGLPLSMFVRSKIIALGFVLTASPFCSIIASLHLWIKTGFKSSISKEYKNRLLAPDDWFSYWRLNCRVAGLHALLNDNPIGYQMENKWTFLKQGRDLQVPVSPFLDTPAIVLKHKNEEGGLGIHFYKNATHGGDWIIQEKIQNSDWVSSILPSNAPLSTFRVITQSRASIHIDNSNDDDDHTNKPPTPTVEQITALSCVFRAGRKNAATDHDSILFNVDVATGAIKGGTTNAHWYMLGLHNILPGRCNWRSFHNEYDTHPDVPGLEVTGKVIPDIKGMLRLVEESHLKLCPDVPFVGWDVVLSADPKVPVCLLEVNLSCNFFRGSFDKGVYLDFIDDSLEKLQDLRLQADKDKKVFKPKSV